jgi:chromate transporter
VLLSTAWLLGRAGGDWTRDARLWALSLLATLLVWRTRIHLLWLLGVGALLGGLGWV